MATTSAPISPFPNLAAKDYPIFMLVLQDRLVGPAEGVGLMVRKGQRRRGGRTERSLNGSRKLSLGVVGEERR